MAKRLISLAGKVVRKSVADLDADRYVYLSLDQAEPNPGNPDFDGSLFFSNADGGRGFTKRPELQGLRFDDNTLNEAPETADYALILHTNPTAAGYDSVGYRQLGDLAFTNESEITLQVVTENSNTTTEGIVITNGSTGGANSNSYGLEIQGYNSGATDQALFIADNTVSLIEGDLQITGAFNMNTTDGDIRGTGITGLNSIELLVIDSALGPVPYRIGKRAFNFTAFDPPTLREVTNFTIASGDITSNAAKGAITPDGINTRFLKLSTMTDRTSSEGPYKTDFRRALVVNNVGIGLTPQNADSVGYRTLSDLALYDSTNDDIRMPRLFVREPGIGTISAINGTVPLVFQDSVTKEYKVLDIDVTNLDNTFETLHSVSGRAEQNLDIGETNNQVIFSNTIRLRGNTEGRSLNPVASNTVLVAELAPSNDSAVVGIRQAEDIAFNDQLIDLDFVLARGDSTNSYIALGGDVRLPQKGSIAGEPRVLAVRSQDSVGVVTLNTIAFTGQETDTLQSVTERGDSTNTSITTNGLRITAENGIGLRIDSAALGASGTVNRFLVYDTSSGNGQVILRELDNNLLDGEDDTLQSVTERGHETTLEIQALGFRGDSSTVTYLTVLDSASVANRLRVNNLTSNRIVFAGAQKELTDDANLTFDGTSLNVAVDLDVDGSTNLASTLTVSDSANVLSLRVTDLTKSRVVFVSDNGELVDDTAFTYDSVSNTLSVDNISISTEATLASAIVSDLTDNRVVIAGTSGELEDDANLTFDGTSLNVAVDLDVDGKTTLDSVDIQGATGFNANPVLTVTGHTNLTGKLTVSSSSLLSNTSINGVLDLPAGIGGTHGDPMVRLLGVEIGNNALGGQLRIVNGKGGTLLELDSTTASFPSQTVETVNLVVSERSTFDSVYMEDGLRLNQLNGTTSLDVLTIDANNEVQKRTIESTAFTGETLTTVTQTTRPAGYNTTPTPLYLNGGISISAPQVDTNPTYNLLVLQTPSGDSVEYLQVSSNILDGSALGLDEVLINDPVSGRNIYLTGTGGIVADSAQFNELLVNNDAVILGNLRVDGATTIINSTELSVNDKNIVLADSAQQPSDAHGGGITLKTGVDSSVNLFYSAVEDRWVFDHGLRVDSNLQVAGSLNVDGLTTLDSTTIDGTRGLTLANLYQLNTTENTALMILSDGTVEGRELTTSAFTDPNLQAVTDQGHITTKPIVAQGFAGDSATINTKLTVNGPSYLSGIETTANLYQDTINDNSKVLLLSGLDSVEYLSRGSLLDAVNLQYVTDHNYATTKPIKADGFVGDSATLIQLTVDGGISTLDSTVIDGTRGLTLTNLYQNNTTETTALMIFPDGTVEGRNLTTSAFTDPNLQAVTDQGYLTTKPIIAQGIRADSANFTQQLTVGGPSYLSGIETTASLYQDVVSDASKVLLLSSLDSVEYLSRGDLLDAVTLQYVTDHGSTTTNPITVQRLTITNLSEQDNLFKVLAYSNDSVETTTLEQTAHTPLSYFTLDQAAVTGSYQLAQQIDVTEPINLDAGFTAALTNPGTPSGAFDVVRLAPAGGTDSAFRVTLQSGATKPAEDYTWAFVLGNGDSTGAQDVNIGNQLYIDRTQLPTTTGWDTSLVVPVFNTTKVTRFDSVGYRTLNTAANYDKEHWTLQQVTDYSNETINGVPFASTSRGLKFGNLIANVPAFSGAYAPSEDGYALFINPSAQGGADSVGYRDVGAFAFRDTTNLQTVTTAEVNGDSTTADLTMHGIIIRDASKVQIQMNNSSTGTGFGDWPAIDTNDAVMYDSVSTNLTIKRLAPSAFEIPDLQTVTQQGDSTNVYSTFAGGMKYDIINTGGMPLVTASDIETNGTDYYEMLLIQTGGAEVGRVKRGQAGVVTRLNERDTLRSVTDRGASTNGTGADSARVPVVFTNYHFRLTGLEDSNDRDTVVSIDPTTGNLSRRSVTSITNLTNLDDVTSRGFMADRGIGIKELRIQRSGVAGSPTEASTFPNNYDAVISVVSAVDDPILVSAQRGQFDSSFNVDGLTTLDSTTIDGDLNVINGKGVFGSTASNDIGFVRLYDDGNNSLDFQATGANSFRMDLAGTSAIGSLEFNQFNLDVNNALNVDGVTTLDSTTIDAVFGNGFSIQNLGTSTTNTDVLTISGDIVKKTAFSDLYQVPNLQSVTEQGRTTTLEIQTLGVIADSASVYYHVQIDPEDGYKLNLGNNGRSFETRGDIVGNGVVTPYTALTGTGANQASFAITRTSADAFPPYFILGKSRGTDNNTLNDVRVNDGDELGRIIFTGIDQAGANGNYFPGLDIRAIVSGSPSDEDMYSNLVVMQHNSEKAQERLLLGQGSLNVYDYAKPLSGTISTIALNHRSISGVKTQQLAFKAGNSVDSDASVDMSLIKSIARVRTDGSEEADFEIQTVVGGTLQRRLHIDADQSGEKIMDVENVDALKLTSGVQFRDAAGSNLVIYDSAGAVLWGNV